ncbi:putative organic cation transporter protein-like [Apostichopus japonicus]|uniref:Putative organic cation transporter protein-like n=1 Tax=Stichopus japonicus TaxID=307972 RepID=A0A2G8KSE0_STIJA|nr:putative organic cation transporter protein-like [Apostichopus japonicus]
MVNFDDILKHNVKFGSFQIRTYAIIFISPLLVGCTTFLQVFIAGVGDHWCQIPQWDQRDCDRLVGFKNETCEDILKSLSTPSLPLDDDRDPQCLTYNFTGIDLEQAYSDRNNGLLSSYDVTECNEGMVFDRSVYRSTMTEDWELVCEQSLVPNLLQSLYMAGFLLGCLLFGWLADKTNYLKSRAVACGKEGGGGWPADRPPEISSSRMQSVVCNLKILGTNCRNGVQ